MAELKSVCLLLVLVACVLCDSGSHKTTSNFSCDQVRELFEGKLGSPSALLPAPHHETESSICRHGSKSGHLSCCTVETEERFSEIAEKRLKESVRTRNHALKKHIRNILAKYQDRLTFVLSDAQNRTSHVLTHLYKVPRAEHEAAVTGFFTSLERTLLAQDVDRLEEIVRDFFKNLFPPIFNFVLSSQGQGETRHNTPEYRECLTMYADQIQPFGNMPDLLLKQLRRSFQHALVFQDSLTTLVNSITATEAVNMDGDCRRALVRLQVCAGCRGVSTKGAEVKPCRGLCLNVMRGCLYKIAEISSSWDDLVVAFENLQVGMMGHHELQVLVMYLDMNLTDSILMAMEDSPRIYDEVLVKCEKIKAVAPADADRKLPTVGDSLHEPNRPTALLHEFRSEVKALIKFLEDSKGMFNRLADEVCQDNAEYDQDMQSDTCWNGHSVGRYMEQVPEANFLSQARLNSEVKVSVTPDYSLLQVKDTLTHMRRNLSSLLNAELMMSDSPYNKPYKHVASSEGSGLYRTDVIVDDEDLVSSGSGSGSGDKGREDDDEDETTKGSGVVIPEKTPRPTTASPRGAADTTAVSISLLVACVTLHRLFTSAFK